MVLWNAAKIHKLIEMYKQQPLLWQKGHEDYKDKQKRYQSLKNMASLFEECTPSDIQAKLRSLRKIYSQHLRRIKARKSSLRLTKWEYFDDLRFLEIDGRPGKQLPGGIKQKDELSIDDESNFETPDEPAPIQAEKPIKRRKEDLEQQNLDDHQQFGTLVALFLHDLRPHQDLVEEAKNRMRLVMAEISQLRLRSWLDPCANSPASIFPEPM